METEAKNSAAKFWRGLKIPFGVKLTLIVTLILLGSIWIIASLMAAVVSSEFIRTADETNFAINARAAYGVEERLDQIRSTALMFLETNIVVERDPAAAAQIQNIFFERNPHIGAIIIPELEEIVNKPFFAYSEITLEAVNAWLATEEPSVARAKAGEPVLRNAAPALGIDLLALFYPWQNRGYEEAAVIFFSPQSLAEITGAGSNTTIVVNDRGDILVSPDFNQSLEGANISTHVLFQALWKEQIESARQSYTEGENRYIGAGRRISLANAAVFTSLEHSIITGQIGAATRRNIQLSVTVMFLTILATWFFSRTVTTPVKKLIAAAGQIAAGDFDLAIEKKSRDELGDLTEGFIAMGRGLSRREEAVNLVGRYRKEGLVARAMAGEIPLSGEYIHATVLSVNIVSFYALAGAAPAESGDEPARAPEKPDAAEALEHLNSLYSLIAENVEKTGGAVEKIMGPKLIAVWGAPADAANPADPANELMNCVRAAIAVRMALWELNTERESQGKALYMINCGIHSGETLAGRLGASPFGQYAVIGRTVDEAILAAGGCEAVKTDIVITEPARELAGDRILSEKAKLPKSFKSDVKLFGLVNLAAQDGEKQRWPFTLKDVQEFLKGAKPKIG